MASPIFRIKIRFFDQELQNLGFLYNIFLTKSSQEYLLSTQYSLLKIFIISLIFLDCHHILILEIFLFKNKAAFFGLLCNIPASLNLVKKLNALRLKL